LSIGINSAVLEISCVDVVGAFLDHFAVISGKHTQLGLSGLGLMGLGFRV